MNLLDEILDQPRALRELINNYSHPDQGFPHTPAQPIITGMGTSYHAAAIASMHLNSFGIPAMAFEATDLLNYAPAVLKKSDLLVYISQSGTSGEVPILLKIIPSSLRILAVTNDPNSHLGQEAGKILPILAGYERFIASKSFTNSLVLMWLLTRFWSGTLHTEDISVLNKLADDMESIILHRQQIIDRWFQTLEKASQIIFLGHGPHALAARQAAMITAEWTKLPALNYSLGAFRHGPVEIVQKGSVILLFSSPQVRTSSIDMVKELTAYGATCLYIENGIIYTSMDVFPAVTPVDDFLTPVPDLLLVQFFIAALADAKFDPPGFRYIGKVVRNT